MYQRFITLLFACTIVAAGVLRAAQAPSAAQNLKIGRNEVWATAPVGEVWIKEFEKAEKRLIERMAVPISATIKTGAKSSVILIFSNKAQTQIGPDSELKLEKYQEDLTVVPDSVTDPEVEDLKSETVLALNRGELSGKVKLRKDRNSTFTISTPVGAAGIRGTTFRIIYRPPGTGQAFGTFTLTNANGSVDFTPAGSGGSTSGGGGGGGTPGAPTTPQDPAPGTPSVSATGTVQGVDTTVIPQGQQIEIVVTQNAQGQFVPQTPVTASSATAVPTAVMQQLVAISVAIAEQVQQVVIAAPPLPPAPPTTPPAGTPPTTQTETPPAPSTTAPVSTQAAGVTATGTVTVTPPPPPAPRVTNPGSG